MFISVSISISIAQTDSTNNLYDKDGFIGGPIVIEIGPKPIGGINAIQQEINYPTEALINQLEGRVYVKATIDTLGNVSEVE
ncbi:MAG TPA: hypothetical protein PLH00_05515, partial [Bacteroidaceae bacterium]|nr:hypothetical protein [Bacteroidaceae bacterium]